MNVICNHANETILLKANIKKITCFNENTLSLQKTYQTLERF